MSNVKLDRLSALVAAMDTAPWYSADSRWQSDCVLTGAPDADFSNDGRVVVQANPNFPYRANLDGIVALRNAAPALLALADAADRLATCGQIADAYLFDLGGRL